jgi:phage shock protein PspC (stress-responsive transcriptional regulator)
MKKTLTINLSGSVFHIDDDAYEKLFAYLNQINRHFGNDADAKEIVEDIETRIAEIFTEKIKNGGEVINLDHVNEVIVIMGTPEAISNDEEEKQPASAKKFYHTGGRRLYRDPDDKVLGGVCGGLGAYFSMDPVIIRIIFALIFFIGGSGVLVYLVLWIVVPKATSTTQRLEMKGEVVNIDNISKSIKEEMLDVKENFRNYRSHPAYAQGRSNVRDIGDVLLSVLKVLGTIILVIIGIPFLFVGVVCLIVLFALLFAGTHVLGFLPFHNGFNFMEHLYSPGGSIPWMTVGIALVIGIPLVMLIYAGIKMIFRIKTQNHIFGGIFAGLFIVGLLILIFSGSSTINEFRKQATVNHTEIITTSSDTIYITAKKDQQEKDLEAIVDPDLNFERFRIGTINDAEVVIGIPELRIEKSDDNVINFLINKTSRGTSISSARQNAEVIPFNYVLKDSTINLQSSYLLPKIWRNQRVNLKLKIPVGKTIYIDESVQPILQDVKNTSDTFDDDMLNKYWTMKPDGLTLVNRAVPNVKPVKK